MQPMTIIVSFASAYTAGILMSQWFNRRIKDTTVVNLCSFGILVLSLVAHCFKLSNKGTCFVFGFKAILMGIFFNTRFIVLVSRVRPELYASTLEMCQCFGQFVG